MKKSILILAILWSLPFGVQSQTVTNKSCDTAIELFCGQATDVNFVDQDTFVWFKITGTGAIFHASLCRYTPDITVFEGTCDALVELDGSKGLVEYFYYQCEGSSDEVGFKTEVGQTYYLRCNTLNPHIPARMNITCAEPAANNFCESAQTFSIGETVVYNLLAAYPSKKELSGCGYAYERFDADIWYQFEGTGEIVQFEDFKFNNSSNISVLKGNCDVFECLPSISLYGGHIGYQTESGSLYYVRIHGVDSEEAMFQFQPITIAPNNECIAAIPFALSDTLTIDLTGSTYSESVCTDYGGYHSIWYRFVGDGTVLDFKNLDGSFGNYMDLFIIKGTCDTIDCQEVTSTYTNRAFQSEAGANYLLQVRAGTTTFSQKITQRIAISSAVRSPNDRIEQAQLITCEDTLIGTLKGALGMEWTNPVVWYKVIGEGGFLNTNSLYIAPNNTSFGPTIGYHRKIGGEVSWVGNNYNPFFLAKDSLLYISVSGTLTEFDFNISMECPEAAEADNCKEAKFITLTDTIAANTVFATNGTGDGCNNSTTPSLWYTFTGQGELVDFVFEKQPNSYEFSISKGTCDSLICVATLFEFRHNDVNRERVYFEADETYYIRIFNTRRDFEERPFRFYFEPLVIAENDICMTATPIECGSVIRDSVDFAAANEVACVAIQDNLEGIWYQITGKDEYIAINFPGIDYLDAANVVQLSLFEGTCTGLVCQNDSLQTYNRKKVFFGAADKQYYILAQSRPRSFNDELNNKVRFDISCYPKENNNLVENALPISCGDALQGYAFGANYTPYTDCDFSQPYADLWLKVEGLDEYLYRTDNGSYSFDNDDRVDDLKVFTKSANDSLTCFGTLYDRIFLPAGETYFLRMTLFPKEEYDLSFIYDFDIKFTCAQEITNTTCASAMPLSCGEVVMVNNANSIKDPIDTKSCGGTVPGSYPIWFAVEGDDTWKNLIVSNQDGSNQQSQIWTYEGTCGELICLSSDRIFYAESGKTYYVNINRIPGEKKIELNCEDSAPNDFCEDAIAISYGDTIRGSVDFATGCAKGNNCYNDYNGKNVWYSLIGTGELINLDLRPYAYNDHTVDLTIYEKQCCNRQQIIPTYGRQHNKSFKSRAGRKYLISIELGAVFDDGNFDLVANKLNTANFNICDNAIVLSDQTTETIDVRKAITYQDEDFFGNEPAVSWIRFTGSGGTDTLIATSNSEDGFFFSSYIELEGTCQLSGEINNQIQYISNESNEVVIAISTLEGQRYAIAMEEVRRWQEWDKEVSVTLKEGKESNPCELILPDTLYALTNEYIDLPVELVGYVDYYNFQLADGTTTFFSNNEQNGIIYYSPQSSGVKVVTYSSQNCRGLGLLPVVLTDEPGLDPACETLQPCTNPKDCPPNTNISLDKTTAPTNSSAFYAAYAARIQGEKEAGIKLTVHPNPFQRNTQIQYELFETEKISLTLYAIHGQVIQQLQAPRVQTAGKYTLDLAATDLAPGMYFLTLFTSKEHRMVKLVVQE